MTSQQPAKRMTRKATSLLFCVLAGGVTVWGVPEAAAAPTDVPQAPDPTRATIRYELTGSGVAKYVTYSTDSGQSHATDVPLPWAVQVDRWVTSPVSSASRAVSAQGLGPGSITCTIKVDGKVVSQNTATGDPARVACEYH